MIPDIIGIDNILKDIYIDSQFIDIEADVTKSEDIHLGA